MRFPFTVGAVVLLVACGGGGSKGAPQTRPVRGIGLPEQVVAVPAKDAQAGSLRTALAAASVPPGSDYARAETWKELADPALKQFDIVNAVLEALALSHYEDPENVNAGPYAFLVPSLHRPGLKQGDTEPVWKLDRWAVDSKMIEVDGVPGWRRRCSHPRPGDCPCSTPTATGRTSSRSGSEWRFT